jgi:hypothetical protein
MRLSLRTLVLSSAALCSTAAFAASTNQARVDVPFNFVVKNHTYQAGAYKVAIEPARSLVTLYKIQNPVQSGTWLVGPVDKEDNPLKVRLTFDTIGTDRVLRTIQFGELTTQNLDAKSKHKVGETKIVGE